MPKCIKIPGLLLILLFIIVACKHRVIKRNKSIEDTAILKEQDSVYSVMQYEICDSVLSRIHSSKPAMQLLTDCYNETINRHNSGLLKVGVDSGNAAGRLKLKNYVLNKISFTCPDTYAFVLKEYNEKYGENSKEPHFTGTVISQFQLSTEHYRIMMKDIKTSDTTVFFSADSLDEAQFKGYEPGYWITVKYEIIKNKHTNKYEFILNKGAIIGGVGVVMVKKQ